MVFGYLRLAPLQTHRHTHTHTNTQSAMQAVHFVIRVALKRQLCQSWVRCWPPSLNELRPSSKEACRGGGCFASLMPNCSRNELTTLLPFILDLSRRPGASQVPLIHTLHSWEKRPGEQRHHRGKIISDSADERCALGVSYIISTNVNKLNL